MLVLVLVLVLVLRGSWVRGYLGVFPRHSSVFSLTGNRSQYLFPCQFPRQIIVAAVLFYRMLYVSYCGMSVAYFSVLSIFH